MYRRNVLIIICVLCILLALAMSGCASLFPKEDEMLSLPYPSMAAVEYRTVHPYRGDITRELNVMGIVVADFSEEEAQHFSVNGYIEEVFVQNEQYVTQGQLIASLTEPENRESVERAFNQSLFVFNTASEAYEKNLISEYEYKKAELEYKHAKDEFDTMLEQLNSMQLTASKAGYVISLLDLKPGDPIGHSIAICGIASEIDKKIAASSTMDNIDRLPVGKELILKYKNDEYPGYVHSSKNTHIDFKSDYINVMDLGDVVTASMVLESGNDLLLVPKNAVILNGQNTGMVRVLQDNAPISITIKLGLSNSKEIEILPGQGIDEDSVVIIGVN